MGSLIIEEACKDPAHFTLAGAMEHAGHPQAGQPVAAAPKIQVSADLKALLPQADLLIEFTTPEATLEHARLAAEAKVAMVIGTTGLSEEQFVQLRELSKKAPIFWSPNMSIGIVVTRRTIHAISQLLFNFGVAEQTKAQISETHHTRKKDAPSGTAKALAQELFKATGWLIKDEEIEAKREGEVIGIHSVTFDTGPERITLQHEATDRRVFAQGALLVARNFSAIRGHQSAGWYDMDDFVSAMEKTRTP